MVKFIDLFSGMGGIRLGFEQAFKKAGYNTKCVLTLEIKTVQPKALSKKEGSRQSLFLEEEKPLLAPLPATRFELIDWKTATVQFNYHISVDECYTPFLMNTSKES